MPLEHVFIFLYPMGMKRVLGLTSLILLLFNTTIGQEGMLTLHGKVQNKNAGISLVDIEVYRNNEVYYQGKTLRNGSFKVDLELGFIYNIAFMKEGFVEKSVDVIGKADSTIVGRYFFQIDIELFKVNQNEVDETMLPPVAKLYIKEEEEGFRYDKKYVKWISNEYHQIDTK